MLEGKTEILNELTNDKYASFINKDALVYNSFIYGSNDGIGQMITVQGDARTATDYIPVIGGQAYYLYTAAFDPRLYAFYDENKQFIKHAASTNSAPPITQPLIAPANAAYLRLTILENRIPDAWMGTSSALTMPYREYMPISVETISAVENPVHHIGREFSTFTKCLCIGDSLTEGVFNDIAGTNAGRTVSQYSYPSILQKLSGVDCTNLGNGGFTSIRWYDYHQNDDLSGHDCAIIMLGVNDGLLNTSEDDMITALNAIINKVKTENAGIKIFLSTLTTAYKHINRWAEINEIIRGIANMTANVYLVDIAQYSEINRLSAYTNGHLTAIGYQKMAAEFMAYISNIIATKADDFKFIQFIGSDWADVDAAGI